MLAVDVVERLKELGWTITTAESCTGGLIGASIVEIPGASRVFRQGYITYCDDAKIEVLGVSRETIGKYFAVSEQTAYEMAQGAANMAKADVAVSVTGVAGPDMEDGKPVGLVYIGMFVNGRITVSEHHFKGERNDIRRQACEAAFERIFECLEQY